MAVQPEALQARAIAETQMMADAIASATREIKQMNGYFPEDEFYPNCQPDDGWEKVYRLREIASLLETAAAEARRLCSEQEAFMARRESVRRQMEE